MDAILQAVDMFGESKQGDAIIVMAYDLEGNHGANAKKVAKALEDHHVRLFGLALGPVGTKNVATSGQSTTAWGLATADVRCGRRDLRYRRRQLLSAHSQQRRPGNCRDEL